jgi:sRNA-binding regulator protein Hfq
MVKFNFKSVEDYKLTNEVKEYLHNEVKEKGIVDIIDNYCIDTKKAHKDLVYSLFDCLSKADIKTILDMQCIRIKYFHTLRKHKLCEFLSEDLHICDIEILDNEITFRLSFYDCMCSDDEILCDCDNLRLILSNEYDMLSIGYKEDNISNYYMQSKKENGMLKKIKLLCEKLVMKSNVYIKSQLLELSIV